MIVIWIYDNDVIFSFAEHCKDCKNFNSMFSILSGLDKVYVSRLRNTWEKLPNKYMKMYDVSPQNLFPLDSLSAWTVFDFASVVLSMRTVSLIVLLIFFVQDLKELIDPSKNMSKYRSYVGSDHVQPPMVSQ